MVASDFVFGLKNILSYKTFHNLLNRIACHDYYSKYFSLVLNRKYNSCYTFETEPIEYIRRYDTNWS